MCACTGLAFFLLETSSYPVFATEPLCEKSSLEAVDSTSTVNQSSDTALPFPLFEPAESARNDKDTDVSNRKKASPYMHT